MMNKKPFVVGIEQSLELIVYLDFVGHFAGNGTPSTLAATNVNAFEKSYFTSNFIFRFKVRRVIFSCYRTHCRQDDGVPLIFVKMIQPLLSTKDRSRVLKDEFRR